MIQRLPTRIAQYDYALPGAYFVTLVTHARVCLFGEVKGEEVVLSEYGGIACGTWMEIPEHFHGVSVDDFVVMPNHVHGIIVIEKDVFQPVVGARHASSLRRRQEPPSGVKTGSLGAMIGSYKASVTRRINQIRTGTTLPIWQRNYYDHIIRDERDWETHRGYILANPARWAENEENRPAA